MPFYEYQCRACGAQVEVMQKISDAPLKKCAECSRSMLTKLVSAPVFRLKGGGWYETDFKSDQDRKRNLVEADKAESKPEERSESKAADKPEAKAEAKPESKAESKPQPKAESKPKTRPVRKKSSPRSKGKSKR